jgi:phosphoenolpyruvate-protein phosphotransferase (PTS system enzyme I)
MERKITGVAASPGQWVGMVHRLADIFGLTRISGNPSEEAHELQSAIGEALQSISALALSQEGEAADMLAFQAAMLEDPALSEPAFLNIAGGIAAETAWRGALDAEIAGYEASDDEYFRARAVDLADIRDRVLSALFRIEPDSSAPPGAVIVADDLKPSDFLGLDWSNGGAIALAKGSPSSHAAMLARAKGIPTVVGLGSTVLELAGAIIVDGTAGSITANPDETSLSASKMQIEVDRNEKHAAEVRIADAAITRDGTAVKVLVNVAALSDLEALSPAHVDGIGLVRTEFLVERALHDEEAQLHSYAALVGWAQGRPVTIRTFDAGGDKPVKGYTIDGETNPFLGLRGIRLSLKHPQVFKVQMRAILRAAALGPVKIMLPMVTSPDDLEQARQLMQTCQGELLAEGKAHGVPELGIMVEVPAVAMAPNYFDAAFYSIGSNDLTQYATAAGRDSAEAARWADVTHPGVLAMIGMTATHGKNSGREVSLCGDAGGDASVIGHLLRAGVSCLSVAPSLVASAKAAIRATDLSLEVAA